MSEDEELLEEGRISRGIREARRQKACLENRLAAYAENLAIVAQALDPKRVGQVAVDPSRRIVALPPDPHSRPRQATYPDFEAVAAAVVEYQETAQRLSELQARYQDL